MGKELQGKKIAVLAADMFERIELDEPVKAFKDAGADVQIVSLQEGEIDGFDHYDKASSILVDRTVEEARADDFDALYVPGGVGNPDTLRADENAVRFVDEFFEARKPVAAMCHGPWVVVEAGRARGRRIASWPSIQTDIRNAGGEWADEPVVESDGLLTSRGPDDLEQFVPALVEHFARARVGTGTTS